jgi:hypothetical protein
VPNYDDVDPFAGGDKTPSLKFPTIGTAYDCTVTEAPKLVQSRDFKTKLPAWWDKEETQPKMAVVINVEVDGEGYSIWATKPSAMFRAIQDAQREAGQRIAVGGRLQVAFTHEADSKSGGDPAKQYAAKYTPPQATPGADPFGDTQPAAQPQRQQPPAAAPPWEQQPSGAQAKAPF